MTLPAPVESLWQELEAARAEVLRELAGLTERQGDWKPSDRDWSVGEIVDHLTIAENAIFDLQGPVLRVTGYDVPYPAARVEEEYLPDLDRVLDAVDRSFGW